MQAEGARSRAASAPEAMARVGAALLILIVGAIHAYETPDQFESVRYLGALFAADAVGGLVAAVGIYLNARWGWVLGILAAAGPLIGYAITRSVGLPQDTGDIGNWAEPLGVVSLVAEAAFVLVALVAAHTWARRAGPGPAASA